MPCLLTSFSCTTSSSSTFSWVWFVEHRMIIRGITELLTCASAFPWNYHESTDSSRHGQHDMINITLYFMCNYSLGENKCRNTCRGTFSFARGLYVWKGSGPKVIVLHVHQIEWMTQTCTQTPQHTNAEIHKHVRTLSKVWRITILPLTN